LIFQATFDGKFSPLPLGEVEISAVSLL